MASLKFPHFVPIRGRLTGVGVLPTLPQSRYRLQATSHGCKGIHSQDRDREPNRPVYEGLGAVSTMRLLRSRSADSPVVRREEPDHSERARRRRGAPEHQGLCELAHHSAALRKGPVRRWCRHPDGDVRERRTAGSAQTGPGRLSDSPPRRLIVAITGASGAIYGIRLLEHLRASRTVETHLLLSPAGVLNVFQELGRK